MSIKPIYILGPCSAETREQILLTAGQLKDACGENPFIFRAGVWKPRTSPDSFQGAGEAALEWLAEVKRTYGIPVATEVATPEHVAAALTAGIDYLWIGARSSANPIAVQAIAEAISRQLSAVRIQPTALLIKNPVNADAALWLGNIERIERTGLPVMAVHRGCNHQPCWAMAHTVRLARPDIPMILDPSHLSGDSAQVPALLDKVTELGLDGAMVEVHAHPEAALSDPKQQIRPAEISNLRFQISNLEAVELNWLRAEIDELDDRLWDTIAARMDVSQRIGEWKKAHGVTPLQPERYQHILAQRQEWAQKNGIDAAFVERVFSAIHEQSLQRQ